MEGENVANSESEHAETKTDCISLEDVSNCSDGEADDYKLIESEPVAVDIEKKLIAEVPEAAESGQQETSKTEDTKQLLDSITPEELARLRKIFGPNF